MPGRWMRVGALVAGVAFAGCAPAPTPTPAFSPPPTPAPAPSAAAAPWTDLVWKQAALPAPRPDANGEWLTAVTAGDAGFVAVGYTEMGPDRHGIVRASPDGGAWEAVRDFGLFDFVELIDVAAWRDGFVAMGVRSGGPIGDHAQTVLFESPDGRTWSRLPPLPGGLDTFPYWIAAGDPGVIVSAYGTEGGPLIWLARDGRTFERVELQGAAVDGFVDPEPSAGGFLALGSEVGVPRLLRSADGVDWTATTIDDRTERFANDLIVGADAYLVLGMHAPGCTIGIGSCGATPVAWWSADGSAWGELVDDGTPVVRGASVVASAGAHGFVAVDGLTASWSRDGYHWRPLPEPGDGRVGYGAVVVWRDRIVAVGQEQTDVGPAAARILVGG